MVPVAGLDLHFRPEMDENIGIAGPLPGDQQSTGLLDLIRSSPATLTETIKGRQCLPFIVWCRWPDSNRHAVASGGF